MAKELKLRYVNELAGTFVLATLLVVIAGVILVGRAQGWFTPVGHVTLNLPEAGSLGLERGAAVLILGTSAGTIDDITVTDDGRMVATASIRRDFMRFVREDSVAVIRMTLGVGDAYVEISRGSGAALPAAEPTIPALADEGPTQAIGELTTAIRKEVVPTLQELRRGLHQYSQLAAELRDPAGPFQESLARIRDITAQVDSGQGLAGRLLRDEQWADDVEGLLTKLDAAAGETERLVAALRQSADRVPKIGDSVDAQIAELTKLTAETRTTLRAAQVVLKNMEGATAEMPETVRAVNRTMQELPALVLQANETLRQTQRLVEAMQRNWLISPGIGEDAPARLRPGQAGGP